jgi:hypothetical protein
VDDRVKHSVLEEKFAALESGRKFLTDRLLDDAWSGKPNQRSRFGDVQVAEHRE